MEGGLNILILSCGTRNKIVQYFKQVLSGKGSVIATDASDLAPALYESDKYFVVPKITADDYLATILKICKENKVKAVLSLIDPELSLLSKHQQDFLNIGVMPIVSGYEVVETCFDKYKMYEFLKQQGFNTIKSYINKDEFYKDKQDSLINYPVFVKPVKGSASININKVFSDNEVDFLFDRYDNLMIQEYMDGTEYGIDAYIDLISEEIVSIFAKEKILMRAGETDKSKSVKNKELFDLVKNFIRAAKFKGIIDIDIFEKEGQFYISEVNPRFGGGYPHAFETGVNIPQMIVNNMQGNPNICSVGEYVEGTYMMKYLDLKIISK